MKIFIENDVCKTPIDCEPSDCVAKIKCVYVDSGKCLGREDFIELMFKNKKMEDTQRISAYGVKEGDVLVHTIVGFTSYAPQKYKKITEEFEKEHEHDIEQDVFNEKTWNPEWSRGEEWRNFPNVIVDDVWGTEENPSKENQLIKRSSIPPPKLIGESRELVCQYITRVNGCHVNVLHRMEGRWNGDFVIHSQDGRNDKAVGSSTLIFDRERVAWSKTESITHADGICQRSFWIYKPVADGLFEVTTNIASLKDKNITLREIGNNVLIMTANDRSNGRLVMAQTTVFNSTMKRNRTTQHFDEEGEICEISVCNEDRVLDTQTGAVAII
eukprot:TRINITY_DN8571_c0_g1_i1.p1 TRINITY_DN8571_c0_g1~~TRINITY_DN8571_c0_g1_i1.p1  ORF type:complete len:328 (+),score=80.07 TRINITY_DN8571_c0_g1_i1:57-1040(+)